MKSRFDNRDQFEHAIKLLRRSSSFWRRGLFVLLLGVSVVVPYVLTRPRSYRSETVIVYQETIRSADLTGGEASGENARRVGARLREVLLSRASLDPIIKDLHLYPGDSQLDAVDEMRKHVTFRAREGDTFEIAFVASTPSEAQEVTRRLGDCIVQEAATRRAEHAKTLKEFLAAENERNKVDLRQKDAELAAFTASHPALVARLLGQPAQASLGAAPAAAPTPTAYLEARARQLQRQLRTARDTPSPPAAPAPTFQPPPDSADLVAARKELADKLSHFTDKHPDVSTARAHLAAAEAAQAAATRAAYEAFLAKQPTAPAPPEDGDQEAALRRQLRDTTAQLTAREHARRGADATAPSTEEEVALEVEFRRLQREVDEGREREQQLDEKLFKASITASSVMNDRNIQVSVLDPAFLPSSPISKPRSYLLAGLLALCLLLALGAMFASAVADDRIYDRIDIERLELRPVVGVIPRAQSSVGQ